MKPKFRAWDVQKKFYGDVDLILFMGDEMEIDYAGHLKEPRKVCPEEVILEQFIGRKDVINIKIYQGDVVEYYDITSDKFILNDEKVKGVVKWHDSRCGFAPQEIEENHKGGHYITPWDFCKNIKVIGDIHRNPELLKQ